MKSAGEVASGSHFTEKLNLHKDCSALARKRRKNIIAQKTATQGTTEGGLTRANCSNL